MLGAILFGLATPSEAAAVGAAGSMLIAAGYRSLTFQRLKEAVYLTARTSAMVCYLFIGSWTFSSVFSYLGGHEVIEHWVLAAESERHRLPDPRPVIIFLLGWPLEWTEIIIIFVPIFLPLVKTFNIDPTFFGILVALNIQTSFNTPPMAMAAYYLKGVAPPQVRLNQIFAGALPFVFMVFMTMTLVYVFPRHRALAAGQALRELMTADDDLVTLTAIEAAERSLRARSRRGICRRLPRSHRRYRRDGARLRAPSIRNDALAQARALDERRRNGCQSVRCTAFRSPSRTSSTPRLSRPNAARRCSRVASRCATTAVASLRAAGAVIIGKTVTTEFAYFHPGPTRNPRDLERTPGGSSSGSAAAVAAGMVPLAIGSQTNGSIIRPAAFCGVFGVQAQPRSDFARACACCRARSTMSVCSPARLPMWLSSSKCSPAMMRRTPTRAPWRRRHSSRRWPSEPPLPPRFAFVRTPIWDKADPETRAAFEALVERLG